jgi:hypothetical protein
MEAIRDCGAVPSDGVEPAFVAQPVKASVATQPSAAVSRVIRFI